MRTFAFSSAFLERVEHWSVWMGIGAAVAGSLLLRDVRFGVACLVGTAFDAGMLGALRRFIPEEGPPTIDARLAWTFAGRFLGKSLLILLAFALPRVFDIWGMVVGVLIVEIALMTVGAFAAATRSFGGDSSG